MLDYFDKDGRPLDMTSWAQLLEDRSYSRIAAESLDVDGVRLVVSTVWIGLDHSFTPTTRHTFETMIFGGPSRLADLQWRWCCLPHAREGHAHVIGWILHECDEPESCGHLP